MSRPIPKRIIGGTGSNGVSAKRPCLLDMSLTEQSVRNPKVYMDYRGFFSSQATYEVDTTSRKKRAFITYRTVQREPYRINRLSYDFRDRFLEQIILPDTVHSLLRTGEVFDMEVLDQERRASPPTSNSAAITILRSITSSMKPTRSAAIIWWTEDDRQAASGRL